MVCEAVRSDDATGQRHWLCRCVCGNKVVVRGNHLTEGATTSCGCYHKKRVRDRMIDMTGERYGMLTVTGFLDTPDNEHRKNKKWVCTCDCGRKTVATRINLRSGNTTSCGCKRMSVAELHVLRILEEAGVDFCREYSFDDLRSKNGRKLRYDFAIMSPDGQVTRLIEVDGEQHRAPMPDWGGDCAFDNTREHDNAKDVYALEHGIPMVRIPCEKCVDLHKITVGRLLG